MRTSAAVVLFAMITACAAPRAARVIEIAPPRFETDPGVQVTLAEAQLLFPGIARCTDIECLITSAYVDDARARALAIALYREAGDVAGVGPEEIMDGGYRGKIRLVPQLPLGRYRQHLQWVVSAKRSIDDFFTQLFAKQPAPSYRWRALQFRFVRSIKKRTPSAYAMGWMIEYNVEGSLMTSAAGVEDTLFHELFHNNDFAHGDWSAKTLQTDYDAIVKRCGTKIACLAPYAPNTTKVRGGTFYAFQQNNGNGVHEYAAELAVRYWKEQSAMLRGGKLARPAFKCGPAENTRAWTAFVDEFFAGRDLVPACPVVR
ncbi:MAG: hypothetical protein H0T89_16125 [Deltaproteobacteria bacterium]|nr:hypothetical protein [Deltaproteobacteria bacterium]